MSKNKPQEQAEAEQEASGLEAAIDEVRGRGDDFVLQLIEILSDIETQEDMRELQLDAMVEHINHGTAVLTHHLSSVKEGEVDPPNFDPEVAAHRLQALFNRFIADAAESFRPHMPLRGAGAEEDASEETADK